MSFGDEAGEGQEEEAHENVEARHGSSTAVSTGPSGRSSTCGVMRSMKARPRMASDAAAHEVGERQPARRGRLREGGGDGGKPAAEIDAEDEGQRAADARGCRWPGRRR